MTPELSTKISNYVQSHGLTFKPRNEVLSEMLKTGALTQAEYDEAINGNIFVLENTPTPENTDIVTINQHTPTQTNQHKPTHPVFKNLFVDSSGNVDITQFMEENIRSRYPADKYDIKKTKSEDGSETIEVCDKSNNKAVYKVVHSVNEFGNNDYIVATLNASGIVTGGINISNNKIYLSTELGTDGSATTYIYDDGDVSQIITKNVTNPDGSSTSTNYLNYQIESKLYYDSDNNFIKGELYSNNKVYGECDEDGNTTVNYNVEDITESMFSDEVSGSQLVSIIKSKLDKDTILDAIEYYGNKTDAYLIETILNQFKLSKAQKDELSKYLFETMGEALGEDKGITKLKQDLLDSVLDENTNGFKNNIFKINSDNAYEIISAFGSFDSDDEPYIGKQNLSSLLNFIEASDMPEADKKACKKHLINTLAKYCEKQGLYAKDIKEDADRHIDDEEKFTIDYYRLVSRAAAIPSDEKVSEPNGELDLNFTQGNTGDCWLISGLKSVLTKANGKEYLNSLLKVDKVRKIVTVSFPGVSKSYNITFAEIQGANHLATGDGDARAIEIAVDRYIKEMAYRGNDPLSDETLTQEEIDEISTSIMVEEWDSSDTNEPTRYDLNADTTSLLYKLLFGKSESCEVDMKKDSFNSPDKVYSLCIDKDNIVPVINTRTNSTGSLETDHAYVIHSSDNKYIYLTDPRDEHQSILKVCRKDFGKVSAIVESSTIPKRN